MRDSNAIEIIKTLQGKNHEAYYCGGYVRDQLAGVSSHDIDIATSATPNEVEQIFGSKNVVQCGKNFLVCRVNSGGEHIEVATFRVESDYVDGRHPTKVRKGTLEEDAQRRDLTINALYYDPITQKTLDPTGQGLKDLSDRTVRFVGDAAERLQEDHVRILRAIRFASYVDFSFHESSIKAIVNNVRLILSTPSEAVKDELNKGFTSPRIDIEMYMDLLLHLDVFKVLIPEIHDLHGCKQTPKHHPEGDVFEHTRLMLKIAKSHDMITESFVWAILMHDIAKPHTKAIDPKTGYITNHGHAEKGKPIARRIMEDLRFDNKTIDAACYGTKNHMKFCQAKQMKKSKLIRLLQHEHGNLLLDLHWVDCAGSNQLFDNHACASKALKEAPQILQVKASQHIKGPINGKDLIALGYHKGAELGSVLHTVIDKFLDGEIKTREEALEYARGRLRGVEASSNPAKKN